MISIALIDDLYFYSEKVKVFLLEHHLISFSHENFLNFDQKAKQNLSEKEYLSWGLSYACYYGKKDLLNFFFKKLFSYLKRTKHIHFFELVTKQLFSFKEMITLWDKATSLFDYFSGNFFKIDWNNFYFPLSKIYYEEILLKRPDYFLDYIEKILNILDKKQIIAMAIDYLLITHDEKWPIKILSILETIDYTSGSAPKIQTKKNQDSVDDIIEKIGTHDYKNEEIFLFFKNFSGQDQEAFLFLTPYLYQKNHYIGLQSPYLMIEKILLNKIKVSENDLNKEIKNLFQIAKENKNDFLLKRLEIIEKKLHEICV